MELGKFFPDKSGIHIPMFVNVSTQTSMPQYDPARPIWIAQSIAQCGNLRSRKTDSITERGR
jgi:cell surface protein SprA